MSEKKPRRLTAKGEATRLRIVAAAADLMYSQGVEATSVDDVIEASGTGKSQVYHYFSDKTELVEAVVRAQIERVLGEQAPFLDDLRTRYQVVILSDTFYQFADPLMRQLGRPTLFCHQLETDADGFVSHYKLRQPEPKKCAVNAFKSLNLKVIAAGDSYNDTAMLLTADAGFFMHAPPAIAAQFPQFPENHSYAELAASIDGAARRLSA